VAAPQDEVQAVIGHSAFTIAFSPSVSAAYSALLIDYLPGLIKLHDSSPDGERRPAEWVALAWPGHHPKGRSDARADQGGWRSEKVPTA
jgi:hypothetical protein